MRTRRAVLRYLNEHDRWFADIGKQMFSLDCGEGFELHVGRQKVHCRIEREKTWYLIVDDVPLGLLENKEYLVSIEI
jgi:hypothetical protein